MNMSSKVVLVAISAAVMGASAASAAPIIYNTSTPLDVLVSGAANGDAIAVGDKIFFNFTYDKTGLDMPDASQVNVIPITDTFGNLGIRFQGGFQDKAGGGVSDALITYDVLVLDPAFLISDAHIAGNTSVTGSGSITVTETWLPDGGNALIKIFDIEPGTNRQLLDGVNFAPPGFTTLHVQKDILADAGPAILNDQPNPSVAQMSFVDQTFSQVPEPASLGLLAIGATGLLFRRRKA